MIIEVELNRFAVGIIEAARLGIGVRGRSRLIPNRAPCPAGIESPLKSKGRAHAAQFNGIVSDRPAMAWRKAIARTGPPDTTFFIM
jgi:hypothetical protein